MHRLARSTGLACVLSSFAVLAAGCSSTSGDHGGAHDDAGPGDATTSTDGGPARDGSAGPLVAPAISGVATMAGGLHVTWKNTQKDCDTIEGERKSGTEAYKVAFSVPGVADNKHDAVGLTAGTAYTYRLRCLKGDGASVYSEEKAGTP